MDLESPQSGLEEEIDERRLVVLPVTYLPVPHSTFEYEGFKWGTKAFGTAATITWAFTTQSGTIAMTEPTYRAEVQSAFSRWETIADVNFVQLGDGATADIEISWDNIDGAGSILGVTSYFVSQGGVVLETASSLTIEIDTADYNRSAGASTVQASSFEMVVAHEIGHAIGLDHDDDTGALLHAYLPALSNYSNFSFGVSDIAAVQILYGTAAGAVTRGAAGTNGADSFVFASTHPSLIIFAEGGNDVITTGDAADTLFGGLGNDTIDANGGADTVYGSFGNDNLSGGNGTDFIGDSSGSNTLAGNSGADTLYGGTGNDNLSGGSGADILVGDAYGAQFAFGNDTLRGGADNDRLSGGFGQDTFVFAPGDGSDVIGYINVPGAVRVFANSSQDFEVGIDMIDLRAFGFGSAAAGLAAAAITGSGGDTVIQVGGVTITLTDVDVSSFSTGDLVWV